MKSSAPSKPVSILLVSILGLGGPLSSGTAWAQAAAASGVKAGPAVQALPLGFSIGSALSGGLVSPSLRTGVAPSGSVSVLPGIGALDAAPKLKAAIPSAARAVAAVQPNAIAPAAAKPAALAPLGALGRTSAEILRAKGRSGAVGASVRRLFDGGSAKSAVSNGVGNERRTPGGRDADRENDWGINGIPFETMSIVAPAVLLPGAKAHYTFPANDRRESELRAIAAGKNGGYMILTTALNSNEGESVAVLAKLTKVEVKDDAIHMFFLAEKRVRIRGQRSSGGIWSARTAAEVKDAEANLDTAREHLLRIATLSNPALAANTAPFEAQMDALKTEAQWKAQTAELMSRFSLPEQQAVLLGNSIQERLGLMANILEAKKEDGGDAGATGDAEVDAYRARILAAGMPAEVEKKVLEEATEMKLLPAQGGERAKIQTYLEWILKMPWNARSEDDFDLKRARDILDRDHYGLEAVKQRVLEFLAVRKRLNNGKGTILLFTGPPGTGKTSISASIAEALGRNFQRISLGGVSTESKIRGHGRTYQGSMPGMIVDLLARAGTKNPVILLDEVEKMPEGGGPNGDPTAALLEVLDPQQNATFTDHYLGVPFDLSEVIFIATANDLDRIPGPLRDRMEIVEFTSYTPIEKLEIAKRHLVKRARESTGLTEKEATIPDPTLSHMIDRYTSESGVRNIGRMIEKLFGKLVAAVETGTAKTFGALGISAVEERLGTPPFSEKAKVSNRVGVATGLAWTQTGGVLLQLEVAAFPEGRGKIEITGNLKQVMTESAKIALAHVRSLSGGLGIDPKLFNTMDLNIHFPEGATPKDGPSAGITMVTAIASRLTGRPVAEGVAMTGEVTLTGEVHAIGGLKEKSMAAFRAGYRKLLFPEANLRDLEGIPQEVREGLEFIPVKTTAEVLDHALEKTAAEESLRAPEA